MHPQSADADAEHACVADEEALPWEQRYERHAPNLDVWRRSFGAVALHVCVVGKRCPDFTVWGRCQLPPDTHRIAEIHESVLGSTTTPNGSTKELSLKEKAQPLCRHYGCVLAAVNLGAFASQA